MTLAVNYYWRLAATGSCFALFGIGGIMLSTLVFPSLLLTSGKNRMQYARRIIQRAFALFIWLMETLGIMRLEVFGKEKLRTCRNTLVLANHPTLIDIVGLISLMPTAGCVVKHSLWRNPLLGGVVRAARYIDNADPENLISDCTSALAEGDPLIIFPEGTRTRIGHPLHFLRGASYIALKNDTPIMPVLIGCTPATLTKTSKWYQIPRHRFHLRIHVMDAVKASDWVAPDDTPGIAARKLTRALENYFTQELAIYGYT